MTKEYQKQMMASAAAAAMVSLPERKNDVRREIRKKQMTTDAVAIRFDSLSMPWIKKKSNQCTQMKLLHHFNVFIPLSKRNLLFLQMFQSAKKPSFSWYFIVEEITPQDENYCGKNENSKTVSLIKKIKAN